MGRTLAVVLLLGTLCTASPAYAGTTCGQSGQGQTKTSIDIGCKGKGNPITDATFAIIRFLTNGVGVVLVGSMVYAGIQYTSARGDPGSTAKAINRIRSNIIAMLLFVFAYALLNYVIPGRVLN